MTEQNKLYFDILDGFKQTLQENDINEEAIKATQYELMKYIKLVLETQEQIDKNNRVK